MCNAQVLDDNPYAQRSQHQAASGSMAEPMEVEEAGHMEAAEMAAALATGHQSHHQQQLQAVGASPTGAQPDPAAGGHERKLAPPAEEPSQAASGAAAEGGGAGVTTSQAADAPDIEEAKRGKKKVRFQEPWAPPHRREGQQPR